MEADPEAYCNWPNGCDKVSCCKTKVYLVSNGHEHLQIGPLCQLHKCLPRTDRKRIRCSADMQGGNSEDGALVYCPSQNGTSYICPANQTPNMTATCIVGESCNAATCCRPLTLCKTLTCTNQPVPLANENKYCDNTSLTDCDVVCCQNPPNPPPPTYTCSQYNCSMVGLTPMSGVAGTVCNNTILGSCQSKCCQVPESPYSCDQYDCTAVGMYQAKIDVTPCLSVGDCNVKCCNGTIPVNPLCMFGNSCVRYECKNLCLLRDPLSSLSSKPHSASFYLTISCFLPVHNQPTLSSLHCSQPYPAMRNVQLPHGGDDSELCRRGHRPMQH
jgi:hypothetical protein